MTNPYLPRDFVGTPEGLLFAVVEQSSDGDPIPCFLRYRVANGQTEKLDTRGANELLGQRYPWYLFHCDKRDADLHGVPPHMAIEHLRPRERARELMTPGRSLDPLQKRVVRLISTLAGAGLPISKIGVTGSVLTGTWNPASDIDLVLYDAASFQRARGMIAGLIRQGTLSALDDEMWQESYRRRDCSLSVDEYIWHERRKLNKAVFEGTKVDLSLVVPKQDAGVRRWRKHGRSRIQALVTDDNDAFDYPARLEVEHGQVSEVVSFTATYTGQARRGELIQASGFLEESADGTRRLLVGSSREAAGEFIKVVGP